MASNPTEQMTVTAGWVNDRGSALIGVPKNSSESPEYDAAADSFKRRGTITKAPVIQASIQKLPEVKLTLGRLHEFLKKKNLHTKFNIALKDPSAEYTTSDVEAVLDLAQNIQRKDASIGHEDGWLPKLRRFVRRLGQHAESVKSLVDYVPDTQYTFVVRGCLSGILTMLISLDTIRNDLYAALAEIPDKMERLCSYTNRVHPRQTSLWKYADQVYAGILDVLECVIKVLLEKPFLKVMKALLRGPGYPKKVQEVIKSMEITMVRFKDEVYLLNSVREAETHKLVVTSSAGIDEANSKLGSMEQHMLTLEQKMENSSRKRNEIWLSEFSNAHIVFGLKPDTFLLGPIDMTKPEAISSLDKRLIDLRARAEAMDAMDDDGEIVKSESSDHLTAVDKVDALYDSYHKALTQERGVHVYNTLRELLAGSRFFDARRGTANEMEIAKQIATSPSQASATTLASEESQTNLGRVTPSPVELIQDWVTKLHSPRETGRQDISECLRRICDATHKQEDQTRWILGSTAIGLWLSARSFRVLHITPETSTDSAFSPISYSVAMLAESLVRSKAGAVIAYFCDLRCWGRGATPGSGALNMLSSLAGQLIQEIGDKVSDFNTACLRRRHRDIPLAKIDEALSLLQDIFDSMPLGSDVYVLIDSFCRLEMKDKKGASAALAGLLAMWKSCKVTVKLVLTDVVFSKIPDSIQRDCEMLYVADDVDGGRYGFNTEELRKVTEGLMIESQGNID